MTTIEYLGVPRRVVEDGFLALESSFFDPEGLYLLDLSIVESGGWFLVLAVSQENGRVRQVGDRQVSIEAARALITRPPGAA